MKIELKEITIRDLTDGFLDSDEQGVVAYGGTLDIRPPYQREFIYKDKQRNAVIESVRRDFPLNVMYWAVRDDGTYEVIDGQQRTLSICQFVNDEYSIEIDGHQLSFNNLQDDQQNQILDYRCMVYFCTGTDSEKLDWFRTINIAGEQHTEQELRNAVYAGTWTADAKRCFSKTGCAAYGLASDYMKGSPIRQEYLETAIDWHADANGVAEKIEKYMGKHQEDKNATPLWQYFQKVIAWVKATFPEYRKEMRGVEWGQLYNEFKNEEFDTDELEERVAELMIDDDVTRKAGIYPYVLNGEERHLSIRGFSDAMKRETYERQKGKCPKCPKDKQKKLDIGDMHADHTKPWSKGGKTVAANCEMLCADCNRRKSGK
jgi:hypothetical protein